MPATTTKVVFPDGFVWGAATAAYQIEGSVQTDGRGVSIWDTFSHTPGRTANGDTGDVACDHYRRLDEDLDLISSLGLGSYRFSVAWPRVQPEGKGPPNPSGLDFYRRLVDGLLDRGVSPTVTLYHWDLPQALEDAGGWAVRDTAERFADYAAIMAEALGDRVGRWITLNEPWCSAWLGYGSGIHAPGRRAIGDAVAATHHLLLGHGEATAAVRATSQAPVGITLNLTSVRAATDHPADQAAARRTDGNANRLFLDPLFRGSYPADMVDHYAGTGPGFTVVRDGDLAAISRPVDFLGVNFYFPTVVADRDRVGDAWGAGLMVLPGEADLIAKNLGAVAVGPSRAKRTEMGWEINPAALSQLLARVRTDYGPTPLYITENGAAFCDYVDPDGQVHDRRRVAYLDSHLRAVAESIAAGVDVRGYFCWSLLDNFEWAHGFSKRFGLVWVDYPTGSRVPKDSYAWYRDVVAANALPPAGAAGPAVS